MADLYRYYRHIRRWRRCPAAAALRDARLALALPRASVYRALLLGYSEPD
jgi:hypothetical protein